MLWQERSGCNSSAEIPRDLCLRDVKGRFAPIQQDALIGLRNDLLSALTPNDHTANSPIGIRQQDDVGTWRADTSGQRCSHGQNGCDLANGAEPFHLAGSTCRRNWVPLTPMMPEGVLMATASGLSLAMRPET